MGFPVAERRAARLSIIGQTDSKEGAVDIYSEPMLNVNDASRYLGMPTETLRRWRSDRVIHSVSSQRRGWPTLPFAAVVEAFVLRELRSVGFTRRQIVEAADGVRREFDDEFGLARPGVGYDEGLEIFLAIGGEYYRARDRQQAIKQTVRSFHECIQWVGQDPQRLKLARLGNVYLDPRFGWGQPVAEPSRVPVQAIMGLWYAGESIQSIAHEYDMSANSVDDLVRAWSQANDELVTANAA